MKSPKSILAEGLREDFVEFIEGDEDIQSILMDKLSVFMDKKCDFVDEDSRYDIALEILMGLSIR